jgi:hypothetical protein
MSLKQKGKIQHIAGFMLKELIRKFKFSIFNLVRFFLSQGNYISAAARIRLVSLCILQTALDALINELLFFGVEFYWTFSVPYQGNDVI